MPTMVPAAVWLVTIAALTLIVVFDLTVVSRREKALSGRAAFRWVMLYVILAAVFALFILVFSGGSLAAQFAAGYVTEYCLSVDNLFVFMIIMSRLAVPIPAREKALYIGIILSIFLRAPLIIIGAAAESAFTGVLYLFGAILIYTSIRLAANHNDEESETIPAGRLLRTVTRMLPMVPEYMGNQVMTVRDGRRVFTALIVVIIAIGIANIVFALDSIPAILGLTHDAYIVLTANIFALLGLRQLYTLVNGLLARIRYLNAGLVIILMFIGLKMIAAALGDSGVRTVGLVRIPAIGTYESLAFIVVVLGAVTVANYVRRLFGKS
jgi:TerC family integral membrane protein